ncbi:MAG: hypothetical protein ACI9LO_003234 [Planctomycetota bacterium]|jgi:hypothetical protein
MEIKLNRKPVIMSAVALLSFALLATPAKADHGSSVVAPIATFLAFNWILNHREARRSSHRNYHGHAHKRVHKQRRYSRSHGGYARPGRRQNHNW